jgi:thiaminase
MDEDAMRYYLIQDHRFIDDFVVLLASMVCCARLSVRARARVHASVHASVCTLPEASKR